MLPLPKAQKPVPTAALSEGHCTSSHCTPSLVWNLRTSEGDWRRPVGLVKLSLLSFRIHELHKTLGLLSGGQELWKRTSSLVRGQEAQGTLDSVLGAPRHQILSSLLSLYVLAHFTALSPGRHFFPSVSNLADSSVFRSQSGYFLRDPLCPHP